VEVESFEQARGLDRDALHVLLASERPEQRVWAIWALALSLGDRAGGFAQRVEREPDPGVRRTLAVILASHGEYDLLVALARHDPSLVVRESAIQMVTRLAAGSVAHMRAVVEEAADREPGIRIALLGAIGRGAPDFLVALAQRMIDTVDREVQVEAFETLLRIDTKDACERARRWFRSQLEPWNYVDRWLRAADLESLADTVADLAMHTRGHVLVKLRSPPWPVVEMLVGGDLELLRSLLRRTDISIPARVLATTVRAGAHEGFANKLAAQLATAARGRTLLDDLRVAIELDDDASSLPGLAERARNYADALELADRHEVFDELSSSHPVEHLLGLENAVARWLAGLDAPADLMPLLPDLRRYCADHLAMLVRTGAGTTPSRRRRGELAAPGRGEPLPSSEQEAFRDLVSALDRIAARP
jgi:hypothetical protein